MSYVKIIEAIENEIAAKYIPGAIRYIDEHYENAWSKAIDAFDNSLSTAINTGKPESVKIEGEIYKQTILYLIGIYKEFKRGRQVESFLESLGATP